MMIVESKYNGSAFQKNENFEIFKVWHLSSAAFYSMTLFSTIGYGSRKKNVFMDDFPLQIQAQFPA